MQLPKIKFSLQVRNSGLVLYVLITLLILSLYMDQNNFFGKFETSIQDLMFRYRGSSNPGNETVIISIDDKAIDQVGHWPWNQEKMAELIYYLYQNKARLIVLDFPLPSFWQNDSLEETQILAAVIRRTKNVILPLHFQLTEVSGTTTPIPPNVFRSAYLTFDSFQGLMTSPPVMAREVSYPATSLAQVALDLGHINSIPDHDQLTRWDPLIIGYYNYYFPPLALQAAKRFLNIPPQDVRIRPEKSVQIGEISIPIDNKGRMLVNYVGPAGTFRYVSAADILTGKVEKKYLVDKIALIGFTFTGSVDRLNTQLAVGIPKVEKTATVIENIIHKRFLTRVSKASSLDLALIIVIGLFCAFLLPKVALMYRIILLSVFLFLLGNLHFILFSSFGILTKTIYPFMEVALFLAASPVLKPVKKSKEFDDFDYAEEGPEYYEEAAPAYPERVTRPRFTSSEEKVGKIKPVDFSEYQSRRPIQKDFEQELTEEYERTQKLLAETSEAEEMSSDSEPREPTPLSFPTETEFGRYKVLEPIGKGAMGMVYKGLDPAIDRLVALKTIRLDLVGSAGEIRELKERLSREARAAGKLSHPNIVTVYDVGQTKNLQYIAMEYIQGHTLEELIKKKTAPNYKIVAKIILQVCDALDYAHAHGIVHRDIKPANIMVLENFNIKVMDFGIARFDTHQMSMTQTGVAMGTPHYISPEQLQGKQADKRSDIFSVGVVMYELLTGEKPFQGDSISSLIYTILHHNPPPPSSLIPNTPSLFDRLCNRALEKDPTNRFQGAGEISSTLKNFVSSFVSLPKETKKA